LLKLKEEIQLSKMSATDTPTGMVERLAQHTKTQGNAFVSISKAKQVVLPAPPQPEVQQPVQVERPREVIDMDKKLENAPDRSKITFQFSTGPKRKAEEQLNGPAKK
jgi:hypothetical protein